MTAESAAPVWLITDLLQQRSAITGCGPDGSTNNLSRKDWGREHLEGSQRANLLGGRRLCRAGAGQAGAARRRCQHTADAATAANADAEADSWPILIPGPRHSGAVRDGCVQLPTNRRSLWSPLYDCRANCEKSSAAHAGHLGKN